MYYITSMQVAQQILSQLGGNKFLAMTGARNLVGTHRSLQFRAARKHIVIALDADDTYTLETFTLRNFTITNRTTRSGIYAEELRAAFTEATGLATSL